MFYSCSCDGMTVLATRTGFPLFYLFEAVIIYERFEGRLEKSIPRITVWHHEACQVMTNGDLRDSFFYLSLTQIMDYFSCSPLLLFIYLFIYLFINLFILQYASRSP